MKRIMSVVLLAALLFSACAMAESVPSISDDLFSAPRKP